jgi:hypothetical protein
LGNTSHEFIQSIPKNLPPLLEEFRSALLDEIEVSTRSNIGSPLSLSNGNQIGQQGNSYQYSFQIDTVLNTPDGTPCDLVIPGQNRLEATIVSKEGLTIVLSVNNNIGQFVATAFLQTNVTKLMLKLIERIENHAFEKNPAAARMLGTEPVTGTPVKSSIDVFLDTDQMKALESALGRNLTVIWGPPGTGKTRAIGTITEQLYKAGRTVLVVSHTNTAVDQAIKHVAGSLKDSLKDGSVIRIGEVRDKTLELNFPEVLLKKQVEIHSKDLVNQRDQLEIKLEQVNQELEDVQREISLLEWLSSSEEKIHECFTVLRSIQESETQLEVDQRELGDLETQQSYLLETEKKASEILSLRVLIGEKRQIESLLSVQLREVESAIDNAKKILQEQNNRLIILERIAPLRIERSGYPTYSEQSEIVSTLSRKIEELQETFKITEHNHDLATDILNELERTTRLIRVIRRLPTRERQTEIIDQLKMQLSLIQIEMTATHTAHSNAQARLSRIVELDAELSRHSNIGMETEETKKKIETEILLKEIENKREKLQSDLIMVREEIERQQLKEIGYSAGMSDDATVVYSQVSLKLQRIKALEGNISFQQISINRMKKQNTTAINLMVDQLQEWMPPSDVHMSHEDQLDFLRESHNRLQSSHDPSELPSLTVRSQFLNSEVNRLKNMVEEIDARLTQVEKIVIQKASVIGATLTKTYLSDDVQARKFDTVILDEASMAPIPALWVAALLSDQNLIIVGDFRQLPPIVLSKTESTKKWLGRDIFEASGLKEAYENGTTPDHFFQLKIQHRMLPELLKVTNIFYNNELKTEGEPPNNQALFQWYKPDLPFDNPVILVDTGNLNAWVTSLVKGGNTSRLNFLSATVSVDLAEQLLSPNRVRCKEGDQKRILIISPYRAHANLVSVLLSENLYLKNEAVSGTAHSFQGSEADVVIFDLVADEPHFRVNLFMESLDSELERLLNVALTRARFRLIVLGDFAYCQSHGKKAFLGKTLIPFLLRSFPRVNASDLVPQGLAAKAANAQMTVLGGDIELDSERVVVNQQSFFRLLSSDIARAKKIIIVYSPFMTVDRVAFLIHQLHAAILRSASVIIITKSHAERTDTEMNLVRKIESQLSEIGVTVVHKMHMHEKLVFIDDDITWSGSLNPLSFSNTQEIMERRKSKTVLQDYFKILRLPDLLETQGKPESKCPICGSEMIAAEGPAEPYYWRCVNDDCYTRGIDQPYPFDGVLSCASCNAPVEFGYWGDYPHWRCTVNVRHRQKLFKSHLQLPKMAALIPKNELGRVIKLLKIDTRNKLWKNMKLS